MKQTRTEIIRTETTGKVFRLPVDADPSDVKYIGVWHPADSKKRVYADYLVPSSILRQEGMQGLFIKTNPADRLVKWLAPAASHLPYFYISVGLENGEKYIFRVPTSALTKEEGEEVEIALLDWKEFVKDHATTYSAFVASVRKAVEAGELDYWGLTPYTALMTADDAEEIEELTE